MDSHSQYPGWLYFPAFTLTTALTAKVSADIIVDYLAFANTDNADRTVTVTDGNGKTLLPAITVQAGQLEVVAIPEGGILFAAGIMLSASVNSKVDCWIRKRP